MYRRIIAEYRSAGIDGVIMGCTEIPILLAGEDVGVPLLDTALIHSRAIVRFMLG
jgi:aspartate racemase